MEKKEITSLYTQYKDIDTKYKKTFKTFTWHEKEIKISDYLPIDEKISLINITIQKSMDNGIIHPFKLKKFFELHMFLSYTDIVFSEEDMSDESTIYDSLYASGLMLAVFEQIPTEELDCLRAMLSETADAMTTYKSSMIGVIETLIGIITNELPNLVDEFNKISPDIINQVLANAGVKN